MLTGCFSGKPLISEFSKRHYTKGYFRNRPGSIPAIASKQSTKNTKNSVQNSEHDFQYIESGKDKYLSLAKIINIHSDLKTKANKGKGIKNKIVHENRNANMLGVPTQSNILNKHAQGSTSNGDSNAGKVPGRRLKIIGIGLIVLGLAIAFGLASISFSFADIGYCLIWIGALVIIKGAMMKDLMNEAKEDRRTSLGLLGFSIEIIGAMLAWMILVPYGTTALGTLASNIFGALEIAGLAAFFIGFVMCVIAALKHDEFHNYAKSGINVMLVVIGALIVTYLLL